MADDLRHRYAEALAEQFTWPSYRHRLPAIHERWADSPTAAPCLATLTGQYMGSFYVDEDGHPGMRRTTCAEVADAVMAVRDEELERLRTIGDEYRRVVRRLNREFDRIAHVRRVLDSYGLLDESHYGSKDLLAAFDSQETDHG